MEHVCAVCLQLIGNAYTCSMCNKFVHIICGIPEEEEEGFGKKIEMQQLLTKGYDAKVNSIVLNYIYHRCRLTQPIFKTTYYIHNCDQRRSSIT